MALHPLSSRNKMFATDFGIEPYYSAYQVFVDDHRSWPNIDYVQVDAYLTMPVVSAPLQTNGGEIRASYLVNTVINPSILPTFSDRQKQQFKAASEVLSLGFYDNEANDSSKENELSHEILEDWESESEVEAQSNFPTQEHQITSAGPNAHVSTSLSAQNDPMNGYGEDDDEYEGLAAGGGTIRKICRVDLWVSRLILLLDSGRLAKADAAWCWCALGERRSLTFFRNQSGTTSHAMW